MRGIRIRHLVAAVLAAATLLALAGATGLLRRAWVRGKGGISEMRREARERRTAERLRTEGAEPILGPADRQPVAEVILDSDGGLGPGWIDYGWSPHVIGKGAAARLDLSRHGGLLVARPGLSGPFGGLLVRYRAPFPLADALEVRLEEAGGRHLRSVHLDPGRGTTTPDGAWEAWIPMAELNPEGRPFERVALYARKEVGKDPLVLDALALTAAPPLPALPPRRATFRIDCRSPGRPISPLVYGTGTYFVDEGPQQWTLGTTARRWGGNHASRYNWRIHAWNMDADWFFRNAPVRSAESFLAENRERGLASAVTVPMIGWVAKDTTSCSFPVSRFGPQQMTAWDVVDCGNGIRKDGSPIRSPPSTANVACPPACVEEWTRSLRTFREAGGPSVATYILDNEPMLWSRMHRDVHPDPLGYDELLERTVAYASAIRRADPESRIAGPAEWGWQNLHFSAKDVARGTWLRPDRLMHGNIPLLPWYLRRLREHEQRTGERLLDVVDVHFYPAADLGVGTAGPVDPYSAALRIRSTRSLWDPTYVDESWIDEPMRLLPRLQEWIAENYPGRDLSIGEWSFGAEAHMSGGLATAEALGRFGTEGVHSAYYWTYPADRSPAYWAFRAYRDFDGAGGRFLDRSIPVEGRAALASMFASRDEKGGHAVAVLLNFSPRSRLDAQVEFDGCGPAQAIRVFSYAGGQDGLRPLPVTRTAAGGLEVAATPYSITVVDLSTGPSPQGAGSAPP